MAIQVDVFDNGGDVLEARAVVPAGDPRAIGTSLSAGGTVVAHGWVSALAAMTPAQKQTYVINLLKAARADVLAPGSPTAVGVSFTF